MMVSFLKSKLFGLKFRMRYLWNRFARGTPQSIELPYGGTWFLCKDLCSDFIFSQLFENAETCFVANYLTQGMTVIDVGAHHGFYTLLAAKKVGPTGTVIAFEPSPREYARLQRHIQVNQCRNVITEPLALTSQEGQEDFFVVQGHETGLNSLRPPRLCGPMRKIVVPTTTLDAYLRKKNLTPPNFIKIDTEGAELEVLTGAQETLARRPKRPLLMVEVQDIRTAASWNYSAFAIYDFLVMREYRWFSPNRKGQLRPYPRRSYYNANLIAIPEERLSHIKQFIVSR